MAQALLIMDMEAAIIARLGDPEPLLQNIKETIDAARKASVPVIYVTVQFREGFPEVGSANKAFTAMRASSALSTAEGTAIHPSILPVPGEVHVVKRRVSAFSGSDLEIVLRAKGITQLVLCGISTSGVVLSTVREAADKDFQLTVLEDCCADADKEVHDVLTKKIFSRQAEVMDHASWIKGLES
jgi:nicotinamidase-related amidase